MLAEGRRIRDVRPNSGGFVQQLLAFWGTAALGRFNPEGRGDCWALAFQGGRSDADRVDMPHAQLTIYMRVGDVIRQRLVRSRTTVSNHERASATRMRDQVWSLMSRLGPRVWGTIDAQRRDVTLPRFRRKIQDMGRARWMEMPGTQFSEFEGSEAYSVLSYSLQVNVISIQQHDNMSTNPMIQFHDATCGGMQDSRITTLAQALHEVEASRLPVAVVIYGGEHFHFLLPMDEEQLAPYSARLANLREQGTILPSRPRTNRVAAGGTSGISGVPFPVWYGEELEGPHGRVATAYMWCCYHNQGTGAYLKLSESFRDGAHAHPSFRYCTGCSDHHRSRSSPRTTAPTMEQCVAHIPNLSKQRAHIFTVTCCYDGALAAERVRQVEDPDAARNAAVAAESRGIRLVQMRLQTIELEIAASAVESAFMRRRVRWLAELQMACTLASLRSLGGEFVVSIIPGAISSVDEDEAAASINRFTDADCTSLDQLADTIAILSHGLGLSK
jgi:hypothetical protein